MTPGRESTHVRSVDVQGKVIPVGTNSRHRPGPLPVDRRRQGLAEVVLDFADLARQQHTGPVLYSQFFFCAAKVLVVAHAGVRELLHTQVSPPGDLGALPDQFVIPIGKLVNLGAAFFE